MITKLRSSLYLQVLCAVILAIIFGVISPEAAQNMKPLGDGFIKLIKMCIPPIIFCTIVLGIVGGSDLKKVGKVGLWSLLYFEILNFNQHRAFDWSCGCSLFKTGSGNEY